MNYFHEMLLQVYILFVLLQTRLWNYMFPPDGWLIYSLDITIVILSSIMNTVLNYLETASGIHYVAQYEFYR
jgi:hypothetical protein